MSVADADRPAASRCSCCAYLLYALLRGEKLLSSVTAQGWLQIAFYVAVLTALTPLLGGYMARVYSGRARAARPRARPGRALLYRRSASTRTASRTGRPTRARCRLQRRLLAGVLYLILRTQGIQPVQPRGLRLGALGRHLQHHLLVRHQHELAVLRRRDDALLLLADGRAGGAELRLGRGRHGRARRVIRGFASRGGEDARELLAGPHADAALHPAADLVRRRADPRLPGRDPDPRRLGRRSRP